jgi:hypothetical protein
VHAKRAPPLYPALAHRVPQITAHLSKFFTHNNPSNSPLLRPDSVTPHSARLLVNVFRKRLRARRGNSAAQWLLEHFPPMPSPPTPSCLLGLGLPTSTRGHEAPSSPPPPNSSGGL